MIDQDFDFYAADDDVVDDSGDHDVDDVDDDH